MAFIDKKDLLENALDVVKSIEAMFEDPDDDWATIAIVAHEKGITIAQLDVLDKPLWAPTVVKLCEKEGGYAAVVVNSVWTHRTESGMTKEEVEEEFRRAGSVKDMEGSEEAVLVIAFDQRGADSKTAKINRYEDRPPVLDPFEDWGALQVDYNLFQPLIDYFQTHEEEN